MSFTDRPARGIGRPVGEPGRPFSETTAFAGASFRKEFHLHDLVMARVGDEAFTRNQGGPSGAVSSVVEGGGDSGLLS